MWCTLYLLDCRKGGKSISYHSREKNPPAPIFSKICLATGVYAVLWRFSNSTLPSILAPFRQHFFKSPVVNDNFLRKIEVWEEEIPQLRVATEYHTSTSPDRLRRLPNVIFCGKGHETVPNNMMVAEKVDCRSQKLVLGPWYPKNLPKLPMISEFFRVF